MHLFVKNLYTSKIKEELGIRGGRIESNDVYASCIGSSPQEIVDNQFIQLEQLHDKISENNKGNPKLFMIPKFMKDTINIDLLLVLATRY